MTPLILRRNGTLITDAVTITGSPFRLPTT